MKADVLFGGLEKLGHHFLGQPYGFILQPDINGDPTVLTLVNQYIGTVLHDPFFKTISGCD
jgi:hypothetical protein